LPDSSPAPSETPAPPPPPPPAVESPPISTVDLYLASETFPPPSAIPSVLLSLKIETLRAVVCEDYDRAESLDFAAKRVRGYRHSLETPTADSLRSEIRAEDRDWDTVFSHFVEEQERLRTELSARHSAEREQCEARWGTSVALDKMRKREQGLALAKRFKEAAEMKEQADALQMKLAMDTLLERQRDEMQEFEERKRQGFAFIEGERAKGKRRLMKMAERMERKGKVRRIRNGPRKTYLTGWKERAFKNFDGLALRRYCAEKRAKTAIAPVRSRWG
jgi:hypothetical protein